MTKSLFYNKNKYFIDCCQEECVALGKLSNLGFHLSLQKNWMSWFLILLILDSYPSMIGMKDMLDNDKVPFIQ